MQDDVVDIHELVAKKQTAKRRRLAKKNQKLHAHQDSKGRTDDVQIISLFLNKSKKRMKLILAVHQNNLKM